MMITKGNLLTLEVDAKVRKTDKQRAIAHHQLRTAHLGDHISVLFEDEATVTRVCRKADRLSRKLTPALG